MFNTKNIKVIGLFIFAQLVFSCGKSDKNDLKETQLCLNTSESAQAMSCLDKISSNQTPQAYKLRCAAVFISEGFRTPSSFIEALDKINNPTGTCTGGCSSTVGAITALTFKNADNTSATDRARSDEVASRAFNYCSLADTNIYMQISSLFKIGTLAANIAYLTNGGGTPTEDQIKTAISSLPAPEMGALVISTYNSTCQDLEKASDSTKKYCAELGSAVNSGGTPTDIGNCLIGKLADPNYVCP